MYPCNKYAVHHKDVLTLFNVLHQRICSHLQCSVFCCHTVTMLYGCRSGINQLRATNIKQPSMLSNMKQLDQIIGIAMPLGLVLARRIELSGLWHWLCMWLWL